MVTVISVCFNIYFHTSTCHLNLFTDKPIGRPLLSVNESGPIPHSDVTFTCNYTGMEANPAVHSVEWKNNDTDVTHPSFVYTIKDVSAAHNGNYSCRVGNTIGFSDVSNKIVLVVSEFCKSITFLSFLLVFLTTAKKGDIILDYDNHNAIDP